MINDAVLEKWLEENSVYLSFIGLEDYVGPTKVDRFILGALSKEQQSALGMLVTFATPGDAYARKDGYEICVVISSHAAKDLFTEWRALRGIYEIEARKKLFTSILSGYIEARTVAGQPQLEDTHMLDKLQNRLQDISIHIALDPELVPYQEDMRTNMLVPIEVAALLSPRQQNTLYQLIDESDDFAGLRISHLSPSAWRKLNVLTLMLERDRSHSTMETQMQAVQARNSFVLCALGDELELLWAERVANEMKRQQERAHAQQKEQTPPLPEQPAQKPEEDVLTQLLEQFGAGASAGTIKSVMERSYKLVKASGGVLGRVAGYVMRREHRRAVEHLETMELLDSLLDYRATSVASGMFEPEEAEYSTLSDHDLAEHAQTIKQEATAREEKGARRDTITRAVVEMLVGAINGAAAVPREQVTVTPRTPEQTPKGPGPADPPSAAWTHMRSTLMNSPHGETPHKS